MRLADGLKGSRSSHRCGTREFSRQHKIRSQCYRWEIAQQTAGGFVGTAQSATLVLLQMALILTDMSTLPLSPCFAGFGMVGLALWGVNSKLSMLGWYHLRSSRHRRNQYRTRRSRESDNRACRVRWRDFPLLPHHEVSAKGSPLP